MTTPLAPERGSTVFAEAVRVTKLDANGAPLWGSSSMIQTRNVVSFDFKNNWQAGVDLTKTDGRGQVCGSFKGRDTVKRIDVTLEICDEDVLLRELLVGGTIFTGQDVRTASVGITTSSANITGTFTADDVGAHITGTGIPANTTILSQTGTAAVMSAPATATNASASATITSVEFVEGYQPPGIGEVGREDGVAVELWARRVIGDVPMGYEHWVFPRIFVNDPDGQIADSFMAMQFAGFGVENPNFGSGPLQDFDHDSSKVKQFIYVDALPSPLQDGYQTITAA